MTQLGLHDASTLPNRLGNIVDLDRAVRLDDPKQVLFEQRVVQCRQVRPNRRVRVQLCTPRIRLLGKSPTSRGSEGYVPTL